MPEAIVAVPFKKGITPRFDLAAADRKVGYAFDYRGRLGIERLTQYMTRCPFSLSRLVRVSATGHVVYKAEKDACRAFPGWKKGTGSICAQHPSGRSGKWCLSPFSDELAAGPKRNFQVLDPLDFLAEFTQHIPAKGAHLIRYYGWYSNKSRGMRRKAAEAAAAGDCPLGRPKERLTPQWMKGYIQAHWKIKFPISILRG